MFQPTRDVQALGNVNGFVMSPQHQLTIELAGKLRQKLVKKYQCVTKPEVLPPLFAPALKETSPKQNETLRWSEL